MKKHLIAAAVAAAVAAPAMAQVTISGALDVQGYDTQKRTVANDGAAGFSTDAAATQSTKQTGTGGARGTAWGAWADSQIVLTASEDLGGGLKATGVFTQRIGNTGDWGGGRDKYLQLDGGFGALRFGRFAPAFSNFGGYGNNGTTNTAGHTLGFFSGSRDDAGAEFFSDAAGTSGDYHRQSGVIQYTTPNMSGITATVGIVQNTSDTDTAALAGKVKANQEAITVNYSAGPLAVGLGMGKRKAETEGAAGRTDKGDLNWVGARYDFGPALVSFAYGTREDEGGAAGAAQVALIDASISSIALTVPLGAVTLMGSMYDGKDKRSNAAGDDADLDGYQLSAHYALSKRTVAYFVTGQNKLSAKTGSDQRKTTQSAIGLRHSF